MTPKEDDTDVKPAKWLMTWPDGTETIYLTHWQPPRVMPHPNCKLEPLYAISSNAQARIAALETENARLRGAIASEQAASRRWLRAIREKDEAMGVLFGRLAAACIDCSDLIP
jgi:hypothetical protein